MGVAQGEVTVKQFVVGTVIGATLASAQLACAADGIMQTKAPSSNTASAYDWSGFYAGGHLGYAWGSSNWTASTPAVPAPSTSGTLNLFQPFNAFDETGSFFAGLQAGYNYTLPNRLVLGAEVDASFPSFLGNSGVSIGGTSNLISPALGAVSYSETVLSSGTVRGRIGYAPGNWLFYATGGFAWTYDRQTLTQLGAGASEQPFLWRLGWAAGAGVEVPVAPHWTARLEYLFTDYGNNSTIFSGGAQRIDANFAPQEVRAGLNYQFDSLAPPANAAPMVTKAPATPDLDNVNFHAQTTFLEQAYPAFRSPYQGPQSLPGGGQGRRDLGRDAGCRRALVEGCRTMDQPRDRPGIRARQHAWRRRFYQRDCI